MQKIYFFVQLALCICTLLPKFSSAQSCNTLGATAISYESRCAATGSIKVIATGGSGSYKYKTTGPVNSNFTTSDSLTGLSAGIYTITVNDITTNCTFNLTNVTVAGSYQDPRFTVAGVNVSCDNGNNGSITVNGQQFGRSPFAYSIVAPSPMGVGTSNASGIFTNLVAGDYNIRMTDSCGGIQTRSITINNYTWWIDSYTFNKLSCDSAGGFIKVIDSRGNISTLGGIPGFSYGIVRQAGDTIWSNHPDFKFYLAGNSSIQILARDGCGLIKKAGTTLHFNPSLGANVTISNKTCSTFRASLSGINNFFNASFCLYNVNNVLVACNTTGIFSNLPYGDYNIKARDLCPDTTIVRWFTATPPPLSVGPSLNIYNKACSTFSASVMDQQGLTNPEYCLLNAARNIVACNNNGIFNNISYGSYCIQVKDNCRDTIIERCMNIRPPRPVVPAVITPSYADCNSTRVTVGGDSLFSAQFCLYNAAGNLIRCNTTGIFDSLAQGNQCVRVYAPCYDTTITRCFNVGTSTINNDISVTISNRGCSTFTVRTNSSTLNNAQYCLYSSTDSLLLCNSTGIFNNVNYGNYCIKADNGCPDTLFTYCFGVTPLLPSVNNNVSVSNRACATFTAKITSQQNLSNPQYCLYDSNDVQVRCNTSGTFNNLNYGNYCIRVVNSCYDTTIVRCFTALPKLMGITVSTNKSCSYGYATIGVNVSGGTLPVSIKIYRPDKSLLLDKAFNSTNITIDSIPGLLLGGVYKVLAIDACGTVDSLTTGAIASIATHTAAVVAQCPSAAWLNGSGKIQLTTSTNMGVFTVRINSKNGVPYASPLVPNTAAGGVFTFNDMGAGSYVVSYTLNDLCNRYLFDTVTVKPYYYPNLNRSSAYQCDVDGFSVGAVASNGVGPFSYEIIGSNPSTPSITAAPQASPIFYIDNGTNYSLIRLRALDACGNATLGDASILPLADYMIMADSNCFQSSSTLSVDTIFNSTYAWYKKPNLQATDSVYIGAGYSVYLPYLTISDTGTYVCHITVNTGCVKRSYAYNLNGLCYGVLSTDALKLTGKWQTEGGVLRWEGSRGVPPVSYTIERQWENNGFTAIGSVAATHFLNEIKSYDFVDRRPLAGNNIYRVKALYKNQPMLYSNTIVLHKKGSGKPIHAYPNPVTDQLTIEFNADKKSEYKISLLNMLNQVVSETSFNTINGNRLQVPRPAGLSKGVYTLRVVNGQTKEMYAQKLVFR